MVHPRRHKPARGGAVVVAAAVSAGLLLGVPAACITAPPPDIPTMAPQPPEIVHDSVVPAADVPYLTEWPTEFVVPVRVATPDEQFEYEAFVDQELKLFGANPPPPDGGVVLVPVPLDQPTDTAVCPHRVDIVVATGFTNQVPDSPGGDTVTWFYANGDPSGCPPLEAGVGTFPDVAVDVLPLVSGDP